MKKYLLAAMLASVAAGAFGQGLVVFYNRSSSGTPGPVVNPVYGVDSTCPTCVKQGAPSSSITNQGSPAPVPAGTQVYGGAPLEGSGFSAAIWGTLDKPGDTTDDAILNDKTKDPNATALFRVAGTTASLRGFWTSSTVTVAGVPDGATDPNARGRFIIRAWDNKGGTLTTWAQALAAFTAGQTAIGESAIFTIPAALGNGTPSAPNPNLVGFESFQLHTVPEPSVIALGVLGAGCLFLLRRRK